MRFGLIGTGFWADVAHAAGLVAHADVELVGIWGRDPAKAEALAARHGAAAFAEVDDLFAAVDAVAFSVPPDVQAELAPRAAAAGCALLLEKPLALDVAAAERVVAAADVAGVATAVFFTGRFAPTTAAWVAEVEGGGWDGGSVRLLANIYDDGNPFGASPWRRERGALWDIGPHALAPLLPALGPVEHVTGVRGPGDTVHLALRHAGRSASTITLSLTAPAAASSAETLVWGRDGVARMPDADELEAAYAAAIDAVRTGGHRCDARFGLDVVRVLAAAEAALGG